MMSMELIPDANEYMARNPIIMKVTASSMVSYDVKVGGVTVFSGNGQDSFSVNLAEVFRAYFQKTPKWVASPSKPWLMTLEDIEAVRLNGTVYIEDSSYGMGRNFKVYNGGVSERLYRSLMDNGSDIFKAKIMNMYANFFWTVRSSDWRIVMKETELSPLPFLTPSGYTLFVKERVTGQQVSVVFSTDTVAAIDFSEVRRYFYETYGTLANVFDVLIGNRFSCQVVIEQAQAAWERYTLKWRNSFGVYERMELVGNAKVSPFGEDDVETYQVYDSVTDRYSLRRDRLKVQNTLSLSTGVIRPAMFMALQDLLQSDEVYLQGFYSSDVRVIPSVEGMQIPVKGTEPMAFDVKLQFCDSETLAIDDISATGFSRGGVFSEEFSEEFD